MSDASPVLLGALFIQLQGVEWRVIAYASRGLTDVERRYSQTERKALALVWACELFNMYICGGYFEFETDHKPLEGIYSQKSKPSARVERSFSACKPMTLRLSTDQEEPTLQMRRRG